MRAPQFFYAIHDNEDRRINSIDGPFDTEEAALEAAVLNCNTGEPGDKVIQVKHMKRFSNLGRISYKGRGVRISIATNGGSYRPDDATAP